MEFCKLGVLLLAQQHYDMFIIVSGTSTYYGGANIAMAAYLGGGDCCQTQNEELLPLPVFIHANDIVRWC